MESFLHWVNLQVLLTIFSLVDGGSQEESKQVEQKQKKFSE